MFSNDEDDKTQYAVVVNHEEQYSLWPVDRETPLGWVSIGKSGSKQECLAIIKEVWTDMRPLSLRKHMEEAERKQRESPPTQEPEVEQEWNRGPSLVDRLCEGRHRVEVSLRPEKTIRGFREALDRGYVHVKFLDTRGGTELGVRLDPQSSNINASHLQNESGSIQLVGGLTLDYVKVRCIADIELPTLSGHGHLEKV